MRWFFGIITVIAVSVVAGRWVYLARGANRLKQLDKLARKLDLAVDPANAAVIARRFVRRERAGSIGYLVALAIVLPLDLNFVTHELASRKPPPYTPLLMVLPWAFLAMGTLVGRGVCAVLDARRSAPGPRVARARMPQLSDYVRRSEVIGVRVVVLLVGPALAAAFLADPGPLRHHVHPWLVVAGVAVSIVFWALAELGARALLLVGQPATTLTDLAWDDAIRSLELRNLFMSALTPAIFVIEFSCVGLNPPGALQPLLLFGGLGLVVAVGLLGKPASHFRRRLWPSPLDALHPVTWRST